MCWNYKSEYRYVWENVWISPWELLVLIWIIPINELAECEFFILVLFPHFCKWCCPLSSSHCSDLRTGPGVPYGRTNLLKISVNPVFFLSGSAMQEDIENSSRQFLGGKGTSLEIPSLRKHHQFGILQVWLPWGLTPPYSANTKIPLTSFEKIVSVKCGKGGEWTSCNPGVLK